jgi:hydroxymethylglutaryl-CoA lyase
MQLPESVHIVEVAPRDGLQNERDVVATAEKVAFVDALSRTGLAEIEVSSFVSPRAVPQLADADAVLAGIARRPGTVYSALVPNERGLERALRARVDRVAVFTAASETFNRQNIRAGIRESIERFRPVARGALAAGLRLRGYVSTAFACPFEGPIAPETVVPVVRDLLDLGVEEVSLGDTIGATVPTEVYRLLDALAPFLPLERTALHLHDTRGTALANVVAGLSRGIRIYDSTSGGLGGCPFAPGASGNLASEDLLYLLARMGIATGVDGAALDRASDRIETVIGHPLPSRVRRACAGAPPP